MSPEAPTSVWLPNWCRRLMLRKRASDPYEPKATVIKLMIHINSLCDCETRGKHNNQETRQPHTQCVGGDDNASIELQGDDGCSCDGWLPVYRVSLAIWQPPRHRTACVAVCRQCATASSGKTRRETDLQSIMVVHRMYCLGTPYWLLWEFRLPTFANEVCVIFHCKIYTINGSWPAAQKKQPFRCFQTTMRCTLLH